MFDFLRFDSPFVSGIYKVCHMIILSTLWLVFCIPIFTAGASTAALYYTVQKCIKNERGESWSCFWEGFKKSFKPATAATLIFIVIAIIFFSDIAAVKTAQEVGGGNGYLTVLFVVLFVLLTIYAFWVFAYIARFKSTVKVYFKNALVMAVVHLPVTVIVALIGAGSVLLFWLMKPTVFIMPAVSVWLMSHFVEKVFRRYMSEEDKDFEDELNMDWTDDYIGKPKPKQ